MSERPSLRVGIMGAIFLVLVSLPWWMPSFYLTLTIRILFFSLLAMSFSFLAGQAGMVSLTQAAFFGTSAYIVAILGVRHGVSFPYPPLFGVLGATVLAALFGLVAIRTSGIYFLMITLALGQIAWGLAHQWISMTEGYNGISGIRAPTIAGVGFDVPRNFYFSLLGAFFLCSCFMVAVVRSPFGLALRGIRESPTRMAALGFPVFLIRYVAFVLAGALAGVSGVFFAYFTGVVNPSALDLPRAVWVLLVSILGGVASLAGSVVGASIVILLEILVSQVTGRYMTVIGVVFLLTVLFAPEGVIGRLRILNSRRVARGVLPVAHAHGGAPGSEGAGYSGDKPGHPARRGNG